MPALPSDDHDGNSIDTNILANRSHMAKLIRKFSKIFSNDLTRRIDPRQTGNSGINRNYARPADLITGQGVAPWRDPARGDGGPRRPPAY
jgi:hypothetical protein